MAQRNTAYEVLVKEKAQDLERAESRTVHHGGEGFCPNCGNMGCYDLKEHGFSASSIFFSTVFGDWRCPVCEFEPLSI